MKTLKLTDNGNPVTKSDDGYYYVARYDITTGKRMVPPPAAPTRPKATINPGLFIAIVDSFILGVWLVMNPDLAIYAGYTLTLIPLACITYVVLTNTLKNRL